MYTAKVLLKQILARKERSAIVVTSSGLGGRPIPGCVTYSAAKACSSFMAQALNYELKDKVDVLSWEAGVAGTKMFPPDQRAKKPPVGLGVDGMLKDIGYETLSYGGSTNDWKCSLFQNAPNFALYPMMFKGMSKSYYASLDKLKKEGGSIEEWLKR